MALHPTGTHVILHTHRRTEAMRLEHIQGIKQILGSMHCSKDFRCTRVTAEYLCKARDLGRDDCLECLEAKPSDCEFSDLSGSPVLCTCSLRVYLTKTVGL